LRRFLLSVFGIIALALASVDFAAAHHVLGRPASSLNEDSNTPSSLQGDAHIGDYTLTYMVFPAFPKPGAAGRINLYIQGGDAKTGPFQGKVTFKVRADTWLSSLGVTPETKTLGIQPPDDHIYRQRFTFGKAGDYIITAEFQDGNEPYRLDFPLRIGEPSPIGPIGIIFGLMALVLITIKLIQRRRSMIGRIRGSHDQ
jgi:hypothetical protein